MEAAPFMVGSDANPGHRKRPRGWSGWGGRNRAADSYHMPVNPLKAFSCFVFSLSISLSCTPGRSRSTTAWTDVPPVHICWSQVSFHNLPCVCVC